jgi:GxxExxY protein
MGVLIRPTVLVETVIGCAIEVHRALGPGRLEFTLRDIPYRQQVSVPILFKGARMDCGYRVDFVIDDEIIVELKSVDHLTAVHQAQVVTYLKLLGVSQALLFNFNVTRLVDGLRRLLG